MNRRCRFLLAVLIAAVAIGLGVGSDVSKAEPANRPLSFPARTKPAAVYYPPNDQLEVFFIAGNGAVRGVFKEKNSAWRPPFDLTPAGFAEPGANVAAVFQPLNNQLEVFAVATDGSIHVIHKANNGAFFPPVRIAGPGFADPQTHLAAVFQPLNRQLELFVFDDTGRLNVIHKANNGPWQAPAVISPRFGGTQRRLSAVFQPLNNQLEVFFVDVEGTVQLVHKANNSAFFPPVALTEKGFSGGHHDLVAVFQPFNNQLEVFVRDRAGALNVIHKANNSAFFPPARITGTDALESNYNLAAVFQPLNNQLEVFFVGADGALRVVHKARNSEFRTSVISPPRLARANAELAVVFQPFGNTMEVFVADESHVMRGVFKANNSDWNPPFSITGVAFEPVVSAGECTRFLRRWRAGFDDDFVLDQCVRIMGIHGDCQSRDGFVAIKFGGAQGNDRVLICEKRSRPLSVGEEIERIAAGVAQGVVTAFVAAAPYLGAAVSAAGCVTGVIFACAVLALEVANQAGLRVPGEVGEALAIANQATNCASGDITNCALLGARGAAAAGVTLPGLDVAKTVADARSCAGAVYAACVRLGLAAADAGGLQLNVNLGPIRQLRDCLNGTESACLALGREAARQVGFPLNGVLAGIQNAQRCSGGDSDACLALGQGLVDSTVVNGLAHARGCAVGNNDSCLALGEALSLGGLAQDVNKALRCTKVETTACVELGKEFVALARR